MIPFVMFVWIRSIKRHYIVINACLMCARIVKIRNLATKRSEIVRFMMKRIVFISTLFYLFVLIDKIINISQLKSVILHVK